MHKNETTIENGRKNQSKFDLFFTAKVKINIETKDMAYEWMYANGVPAIV